ncbi:MULTISPECIES: tellurite resistance TerB family protein [unclassified Anabaena]|uniref:tellurite resistance TerB family protein n=1 Tax=unclassified Anabaena TaxID=2619674 RepID=UPI00083003C4|nr:MULTISPECIES: tellurite resistance TerB family protein [unclassified Anabaena]
MNLLDAVLSKETLAPEILSPAEAFAAIVLMSTLCDSYLSDEQQYHLTSVLSRTKLLRNYSPQAIYQLLQKNLDILWRDGFNALFNLAKASLSPELREAAFAVAADLVLGEGLVTEEEKIFLNDLSQALGISRDIATQILQVMSIKNL